MSKNNIFRKVSLDRVSSPEQLNDYIKVSHPSVWLILSAVVALLIGACVWGVYGTLTTARDALAVVQGGNTTCYVSVEYAESLTSGMEVRVGDSTGNITSVASTPVEITDDFDAYALYLSGLKTGDWVVPVMVDITIKDGTYMATIATESTSPVSFVFN